jgi:hypothetical protein
VPGPVTARARDGAESESQCPAAARLGSAGPQSLSRAPRLTGGCCVTGESRPADGPAAQAP